MTLTVGLTFDLRDDYRRLGYSAEDAAEFDSIETIDAIDDSLTSLGCRTDRIGSIRQLTTRLAAGDRWDLVFNIAEGVRGFGRESQVPALLDAFDTPYTFSDPLALSLTLHKGMAKRVGRDLGVLTPDFVVIEVQGDLTAVDLPFPVFVKPVAAGTSMGIDAASRVHDAVALNARCIHLLERFRQPVLIEKYLPGREMTVGIVGTGRDARALGAMEVLLQSTADQGVYSYDNKAQYIDRVRYRLADDEIGAEACDVALRIWRGFGCRDAGRVDVRCDEQGRINFMEVNPLAGLHPIDADLVVLCGLVGISYRQLIAQILSSACQRVGGMTAQPHAFAARGV
jgi:D-alanine-D-alanine ligase